MKFDIKKKIFAVVLFIPLIYIGLIYVAERTDAFLFVKYEFESTHILDNHTGPVKKVKIDILRGYKIKKTGNRTTAIMNVNIDGTKGTAKIKVFVEKRGESWKLSKYYFY